MSLYRPKKSRFYWYEFSIHGKRFRKSTGKEDLRGARSEETRARAIAESSQQPTTPKQQGTALNTAMLAALDIERSIALGADPAGRKKQVYAWDSILKYFENIPPHKINKDVILQFVAQRRSEGIRGQTIRKQLQAVKRALTIAKQHNQILDLPEFPKIKSSPPDEKHRGRLHPLQVIHQWLDTLQGEAKDEAIFAVLTGLRATEIKRVKYDWVRPTPQGSAIPAVLVLPAEATKSRKERTVGLTQQALDILKKRVGENPDSETVFSKENHKRTYHHAAKKIGYNKQIHLRDLRHTFGTLSLASTGDPWAVLSAMGHADLRTTSIYQSSTIDRAINASLGAQKLLNFPIPASPIPAKNAFKWRAMGDSNARPSASEAHFNILSHVLACNDCLLKVANCIKSTKTQEKLSRITIPPTHTQKGTK